VVVAVVVAAAAAAAATVAEEELERRHKRRRKGGEKERRRCHCPARDSSHSRAGGEEDGPEREGRRLCPRSANLSLAARPREPCARR
jgi:hypothetical protein